MCNVPVEPASAAHGLLLQDLCVCVCVDHDREPCKTAEPIEMPFRMLMRVGPYRTMYYIRYM